MNSPHLPPQQESRFQIRRFPFTFAIVIAIHSLAFYLVFGNHDVEGSSPSPAPSPASADLQTSDAKVEWTKTESMLPQRPSAPEAISEPPAIFPETTAVETPEAPPIAPSEENVAETLPGSGTVPIRAATPVDDSPATAPAPVAATPPADPRALAAGGINAGFDFGIGDRAISQEFYKAWDQPDGIDAEKRDRVAKLSVTVGRDGTVQRFALAHLTGVPELDSSVLAAARSVRKISPLPGDYKGESYDLIVDFKLD